MEKLHIIYPAIAMFALTVIMIFTMGLSRFFAIQRQEVSIKYYKTYDEGSQTARLHLLGRHVQNLFEEPPLFYAAVLFLYVTDTVTSAAITTAWIFVALRCLHSFIHLGSNNVSYRFFCFGLSLIALTVLWGMLFFALLGSN